MNCTWLIVPHAIDLHFRNVEYIFAYGIFFVSLLMINEYKYWRFDDDVNIEALFPFTLNNGSFWVGIQDDVIGSWWIYIVLIFGAWQFGIRATKFEYLGLAGSGCLSTMGSFRLIKRCSIF